MSLRKELSERKQDICPLLVRSSLPFRYRQTKQNISLVQALKATSHMSSNEKSLSSQTNEHQHHTAVILEY